MATESSPNAPRQASPARSLRSRMGTMLRRNSSAFSFTRPNTPLRSESKTNLKVDAAPAPPAAETHVTPSPVAESPVREAAAEAGDIPQPSAHIGPSPLAQETVATPESTPAPLPDPVTQEPEPTPAQPEVQEVVSPPVAPESVPEPETVHAAEPAEPTPQSEPVVPQTASPAPAQTELPSVAPSAEPEPVFTTQPVLTERGADVFSWGDGSGVVLQPSVAAIEAAAAAHIPTPEPAPVPAAEAPTFVEEPRHYEDEAHASTFAWGDSVPQSTFTEPATSQPTSRVVSPQRSSTSLGKRPSQDHIVASPEMLSSNISRSVSRRGSKSSMASSYGQVVVDALGRRVTVSVPEGDSYTEQKRGRSRASSIRCVIAYVAAFLPRLIIHRAAFHSIPTLPLLAVRANLRIHTRTLLPIPLNPQLHTARCRLLRAWSSTCIFRCQQPCKLT